MNLKKLMKSQESMQFFSTPKYGIIRKIWNALKTYYTKKLTILVKDTTDMSVT